MGLKPTPDGCRGPSKLQAISGPRVLDSGSREEFDTGSVRDTRAGKGRFDLLPRVALLRVGWAFLSAEDRDHAAQAAYFALRAIGANNTIDPDMLGRSIDHGLRYVAGEGISIGQTDPFAMCEKPGPFFTAVPAEGVLAVAKVFEEGAIKYAERNWELGQPVARMADSALRHSFKTLAGWTDEPHPAQAAWNWLAILHMEYYHPELNDLPWAVAAREKGEGGC